MCLMIMAFVMFPLYTFAYKALDRFFFLLAYGIVCKTVLSSQLAKGLKHLLKYLAKEVSKCCSPCFYKVHAICILMAI